MNAPQAIVPHGQAGLTLMRAEFPEHQISKLPKETRAQIDARKSDKNLMVFNCKVCGGHHHKNSVHLDYVGHAALTDRLLDADIAWSWEPLAFAPDGLPAVDRNGGLWIKLTVDGVTRLGYGHAGDKSGGDAVKETIGDALRNAAMRFGAALDLWHKGDLHVEGSVDEGHSQGGAVDPPADYTPLEPMVEEPTRHDARKNPWSKFYSGKSALHKGLTVHQAELTRIGDEGTFDDLEDYLTSPEYVDFVTVATNHAPHYLDGGPPAPEEFVGCFKLEQRARDMIAIRGNQPAEAA